MDERDTARVAPSDADLERAIASVPGVVSASVSRSAATGRSRLRIRLGGGEDAEKVSWAVAATLRERFSIVLDPDDIRPRLEADPEPTSPEHDPVRLIRDRQEPPAPAESLAAQPHQAEPADSPEPAIPAERPERAVPVEQPERAVPVEQPAAADPSGTGGSSERAPRSVARGSSGPGRVPRGDPETVAEMLAALAEVARRDPPDTAQERAPAHGAPEPEPEPAPHPHRAPGSASDVGRDPEPDNGSREEPQSPSELPPVPPVEPDPEPGSDSRSERLAHVGNPWPVPPAVRPLTRRSFTRDRETTDDGPATDLERDDGPASAVEHGEGRTGGTPDRPTGPDPAGAGEERDAAPTLPVETLRSGSGSADGPAVDDPAADRPTADEPVVAEAATDEPAAAEPVADETTSAAEPVADEPTSAAEPVVPEAAAEEPADDEPDESEPTVTRVATRPIASLVAAPRAMTGRVTAERAAIRHLDTKRHERDVRVAATLEHGGRTARGEVTTVPTTHGVMRAVAEATLVALGVLVGPNLIAGVDRISVQPADDPANALVTVSLLTDRGEETLLGTSVVRGDPQRAVMRATLDALNRRVAELFPAPEQPAGEEVAPDGSAA